MKQKNILLVATETAPAPRFPKTGVLGDVVFGLAKQLCSQGHDARIAIPYYRSVWDNGKIKLVVSKLDISLGAYERQAGIWKINGEQIGEPPVYLVSDEHNFYFGRDNLYGYADDYERFIFFTRAAMEMLLANEFQQKESTWFPDVVQGYDWACGMIPAWISKHKARFQNTRFVLSIHNIGRLGIFGGRALRVADWVDSGTVSIIQEDSERINFLGRGILGADKVVTVNPDYGPGNPLPESARSLEKVLALRREQGDLFGTRGGIDYGEFDPAKGHLLYFPIQDPQLDRLRNKRALQAEHGFDQNDLPLLGIVTRLIHSKGVDLLPGLEALLKDHPFQIVLLADFGDARYQTILEAWEKKCQALQSGHKPFLKIFYGFDEALARRIYASCDLFLIPSREEPAAIQQFIAMHYGAVPVAHRTGALSTSLQAYQPGLEIRQYCDLNTGVGFLFGDPMQEEPSRDAFFRAIRQAIELYRSNRAAWQEIQRHNMHADFSWKDAAEHYLNLYEAAQAQPPRGWAEGGIPLRVDPTTQLIQTISEIDNLPSVKLGDENALLKQAARLVREGVQCDAVYIWTLATGLSSSGAILSPQRIKKVAQSLVPNLTRPSLSDEDLLALLNQDLPSLSKQYADSGVVPVLRAIPGLQNSELAKQHGWVDGRSSLITVHNRLLGQIDILFRQAILTEREKWLASVLTALANSFGFRLETMRLTQEQDYILETGKRLLQARSFSEAVAVVVGQLQSLTGADFVEFYDMDLRPFGEAALAGVGQKLSQNAMSSRDVIYIRDLALIPENGAKPLDIRSLMVVPLISPKEDIAIGVLKIASLRPAAFSSDQERIMAQHLAPQAAAAFQTSNWYERRDQNLITQLQMLTSRLTGGVDFKGLLGRVVESTADVLQAQTASLYLLDESTKRLGIMAAYGKHEPLLQLAANYEMGEGVTGYIAQRGEILMASGIEDLKRKVPVYKAKYMEVIGGCEPNAFLGIPLIINPNSAERRVIGVLKLEDRPKSPNRPNDYFSEEDVRLAEMVARVIAIVVYNAHISNNQIQNISSNIGELSIALAGGKEMKPLLKEVVETIARVLGAEASSLYLIDETSHKLVIWAATGYQKVLEEQGVTYELGEGITGTIAKSGVAVKANTLAELHASPGWAGKQNSLQGKEPNSFLGLPLKVQDRYSHTDKVIGVLKIEDIRSTDKHPELYFTEQDVKLVEMMANVIATVVYNTQVSNTRLGNLRNSLGVLSDALARGQEMKTLVENVVETMADVLHAKASSLYLIDEATGKLVIQAATGYQKVLVEKGATYELGEGITGTIAQSGIAVRANNLDELHKSPGWAGKQNSVQGQEPNSFLGVPLQVVDSSGEKRVIGVLKVEDIRASADHPDEKFYDQDQLLVTMMANVISTVIQNTRQSEQRVGKTFIIPLGILSEPVNAAPALLREAARSADFGILDQLARAIATVLDDKTPDYIEREAKALFEAGAKPLIYNRIASWAGTDIVQWEFLLLYNTLSISPRADHWEQVKQITEPWQKLKLNIGQPAKFAEAVEGLAGKLAEAIQAEVKERASDPGTVWYGTVLDVQRLFGQPEQAGSRQVIGQPGLATMPLVFQRQGELDDDNVDLMLNFAQKGFQRSYAVVVLVPWNLKTTEKQIEQMRKRARVHAVDVVVADPEQVLRILSSPHAAEEFRSLVLRQATYTPPFVIVGAVPDAMFFGRDRELREIIQYVGAGRSCAVIGGRRYGKTSVLQRLYRVRLPEVGFYTVYHDCSTTPTYQEFLAARLSNWRPESPAGALDTFGSLIDSPTMDRPLVLLLDEADKLVRPDRQARWRLFNQLRSLSNSGRAQIVLSGERELRSAAGDSSSPLFNLVNEILLGPLEMQDVEALVTRPIQRLDINLVDEKAILREIFDFTSGHPNVVQRLCRRLIMHLNEQKRHQITLEDLRTVVGNPEFIQADFLKTYFEQATCLEHLCALLMAEDSTLRTLTSIHEALTRLIASESLLNQANAALERLVDMRNILRRTPEGYEFAVTAFPGCWLRASALMNGSLCAEKFLPG